MLGIRILKCQFSKIYSLAQFDNWEIIDDYILVDRMGLTNLYEWRQICIEYLKLHSNFPSEKTWGCWRLRRMFRCYAHLC